jgi:hypothetical protein
LELPSYQNLNFLFRKKRRLNFNTLVIIHKGRECPKSVAACGRA